MSEHGRGVEKNYELALEWFTRAAQQGNAECQYNLGVIYFFGRGVNRNYKTAFKWFREAASQKVVAAQYGLAFMYQNGLGVPKDHLRAYLWSSFAAEEGQLQAKEMLTKLNTSMTESQFVEAEGLVRGCRHKSFEGC